LFKIKQFVLKAVAIAVIGNATFAQINAPAQSAPTGGLLTSVSPVRLLDTRNTVRLGAGETRRLVVGGQGGIPVTAKAVALNVTAVAPTVGTYLTVWPAGGVTPATSSLNVDAGAVRPNAVIVGLGASGAIDISNAFGNVNVLVDVTAWFSTGPVAPGGLEPIQPYRAFDSRTLGLAGKIGRTAAQLQRSVTVTGVGGVPAIGVSAVVLNVTATDPTEPTFLSVWPSNGSAQPNVSSLNVVRGETAANQVIVPVGPAGMVNVANDAGSTHFIVDVMGWISAGTPGVGGFVPVTPTRVADTRGGAGLRPGGWRPVRLSGTVIPSTGVGAVAANFTVIDASEGSFVSVFPTSPGFSSTGFTPSAALPNVSTLNVSQGQTVPNASVTPVGPEASVWVYNFGGNANLAVDVSGYWVGTTPSGNTPLTPASTAGPGGTERFTYQGRPLFWDSCAPITVKVEPAGGANGGLGDVALAVDRVKRATGLPIVFGGTTAVGDIESVPSRQIVIRWRSSVQDPDLAGSTLGYANFLFYDDGEIDNGLIVLRTDVVGLNSGFGPSESWGAVLIHELGHSFGLAHTTDFGQMMYPSIRRTLGEYGAGDLTGMSRIAKFGCFAKASDRTKTLKRVID
jgi:Matrixin